MKSLLLISVAFVLTSCAHYDAKNKRVDAGPVPGAGIRQSADETAEKKAAREKAEREAEIKRIKAQFIENERI